MFTKLIETSESLELFVGSKRFSVVRGAYDDFWRKLARGEWERETFAIFDRFIDPHRSYIDMGAWNGATLLYGCQLAKQAYGIEPDPVAFAELKQNINLNASFLGSVKIFDLCVTPQAPSTSGKVAFGNHSIAGDSCSSLLFADGKISWQVDALTFDDFVRQNGIYDCCFIKIDIEGGEYKILPTMSAYLKKHRPTIYLSLHPLYLGPMNSRGLFAKVNRAWSRLVATIGVIRALAFYKHFYDSRGTKITGARLLWRCARTVTFSLVVTDQEWTTTSS